MKKVLTIGVGVVVGMLLFGTSAIAEGGLRYCRDVDLHTWDLFKLTVCGDENNTARGYKAALAVATDRYGAGRQYLADGTCWVFEGHSPAIMDGYVQVVRTRHERIMIMSAIIVDVPGYVLIPQTTITS